MKYYYYVSILMIFLLGSMAVEAQQLPEIEMVFVKGGSFTMGCTGEQGSDCYPEEIPAHVVTVNDFSISKYEVTQGLWQAVMGKNPSSDKGGNKPVEYVSSKDIQTFLGKLNEMTGKSYRLPTEAEWEYAARGGRSTRRYVFCGSNNLDEVANYHDNSNRALRPVGSKKPNELGIYDMSGNVREWCSDYFETYEMSDNGNVDNPQGAFCSNRRVVRGGCVTSYPEKCRVSSRDKLDEYLRLDYVGFRLACDER